MIKCEDLAFIEEFIKQVNATNASPSFVWGRDGNISANTWTLNNDVPSQRVGIPVGLDNPQLVKLWIGNQNINTFDITLYEHAGNKIGLTALTTVSILANRTQLFDVSDFGIVNPTKGLQLATRLTSGNAKRLKVYAIIQGQI